MVHSIFLDYWINVWVTGVPFLSALDMVTTMRYTNRRLHYFTYFTIV